MGGPLQFLGGAQDDPEERARLESNMADTRKVRVPDPFRTLASPLKVPELMQSVIHWKNHIPNAS